MSCLPLSPLSHLQQQKAVAWFLLAGVTCIPDWDWKDLDTHPISFHPWLGSLGSALRPCPAPGRSHNPKAQQDAMCWEQQSTIKHRNWGPHQTGGPEAALEAQPGSTLLALSAPCDQSWEVCARALLTSQSPKWRPGAEQGWPLWGLLGGAGGGPSFSSHKCTIL